MQTVNVVRQEVKLSNGHVGWVYSSILPGWIWDSEDSRWVLAEADHAQN